MKYIYLSFLFIIIFESCTNKKVEPITPIANFTFQLGKNGEVKFINTSQNAGSFHWEFGDSESSTEMNPIHIYKSEKTYKVKLIVSSTENIKNEIIQEINVNNFTAKSSFGYEIGGNGLLNLKNTSINSKNFIWYFGDGKSSTEENPSHTYNANATYIIKLIASNSTSKDSTQSLVQITNIADIKSSNIFICDDNGNCSLLNAKNGTKIWQFKTDEYILSSPTYKNGVIFISTTESNTVNAQSKIIAIDYQTGLIKWQFKTLRRFHASPIVIEDKLYITSQGSLICIEINNGKLIWEIVSNNFTDSSPTFDNGFIYVLSNSGLEIFDAQNGKRTKSLRILQNTNLQNTKDINGIDLFLSSPAVYKGICYFAFQKSLFAYDIKTQQIKSISFESVSNNSSPSSPTIENDVLYINDEDNLYAVNVSNFTKKWTFKFQQGDLGWLTSPFAVGDAVFATEFSKLYAIDSKTGLQKWVREDGPYSSPNYYDSIVYIATTTDLKALDEKTGNLLWSFALNSTGLGLISSSLIINNKGEAIHSSISGARQ